MVEDLRKGIEDKYNKVEELAKTVPGYKGYKAKEVRREADKLLRVRVARGFEEQRRRLNSVQLRLTNAGKLGSLVAVDRVLMRLQFLADRIKAASYGYAGLFDAAKVREAELDALYSFDVELLGAVAKVSGLVDVAAAAATDEEVTKATGDLLMALEEINETFSKRQDVVLDNPSA